DMTTFVCVCIPEFLSLYETERLVQELAKFEIDAHNIIINQVLFDDEVVESKLLKARVKMQQKYIDQFYMLYDDFNITKLPLLPEEVTGVDALRRFSKHFVMPYKPALTRGTVDELQQRVAALKFQLKEAEEELEKKHGSPWRSEGGARPAARGKRVSSLLQRAARISPLRKDVKRGGREP
ncbi:hypothetical protein HPP92_022290, partial [Vanilla planifolia]